MLRTNGQLLLCNPGVRQASQQASDGPHAGPAKRAYQLSALDGAKDTHEGVDERAQDKRDRALGEDLRAGAETVGAEAEVVRDSLRKSGGLGVKLGRRSDGIKGAQQLVRGSNGGNEEEAGRGETSRHGKQDLQHQILLAAVVQRAQVVKVRDHVYGQPGEGGGVKGDGVDGGAEDGHEREDLPVAHDGSRSGFGQLRIGGRGGGAGEEGERDGDADEVCREGGKDSPVVRGVEGVEEVVVRQVAQKGECGEVKPCG